MLNVVKYYYTADFRKVHVTPIYLMPYFAYTLKFNISRRRSAAAI